MTIWQVDFYRRPLRDTQGQTLWELVICDLTAEFQFSAFCAQSAANADWLSQQLQQAIAQAPTPPEQMQVFRPQAFSLIEVACRTLGIPVQPSRHTPTLKQVLRARSQTYPQMPEYTGQPYDPVAIESPPPQPVPQHLWGEHWQFVTLSATDLEEGLLQQPIPLQGVPSSLLPSQLQLAASTRVPGMVIYGGRQSMQLARWLQAQTPVSLQAIQGDISGVVLAAGLCDRWILATYDDPDVIAAAQGFERRKQASQGLHFLLVQPDDSGITFTGIWLLLPED